MYYERMRELAKYILMPCNGGDDTCFCVSMGTNETADYSVAVKPTEDGMLFEVKDEDLADEMELDEEDLADIKEYEDMIAAMEAGTYLGELIIDINLECECPVLSEYTLYHEHL